MNEPELGRDAGASRERAVSSSVEVLQQGPETGLTSLSLPVRVHEGRGVRVADLVELVPVPGPGKL